MAFHFVLVETRNLDDHLLDERHGSASPVAQDGRVGGNGPPRENVDVLECKCSIHELASFVDPIRRQKHADDGKPIPGWRLDAPGPQLSLQETIRQLGEDARPIPGSISRLGTAMIQAAQAVDAQTQDPVRGVSVPRRDESDTTGIVMLGSGDQRPG